MWNMYEFIESHRFLGTFVGMDNAHDEIWNENSSYKSKKGNKEIHHITILKWYLKNFIWISTLIAGAIPCSHSYLSKTKW